MSDSSDDEQENLYYKIIILGDGTVGKSSMANRMCNDNFQQTYKQTIGVDWFKQTIGLPGDINVSLQIWDIGGCVRPYTARPRCIVR